MRIGILGAGNMARALATRLARFGHNVAVSSPSREEAESDAADLPDAIVRTTFAEAAAFGELLILALPFHFGANVAAVLAERMSGKILIDITNAVPHDTLQLLYGHTTSFAEEIQRAVPETRVVKAFNTILAQIFAYDDPIIDGVRVTAFIAGEAAAAAPVAKLATDIGFRPFVVGPLEVARLLEPLGAIVVRLVVEGRLPPSFAPALLTDLGDHRSNTT